MTRDAKLYYLDSMDINLIIKEIEENKYSHGLIHEIAIFSKPETEDRFIVLSVSDKIDEIILNNGGRPADKTDLYLTAIKDKKNSPGTLVHGNADLIHFLP